MTTIKINEFIIIMGFDNEMDFFRQVKGDDPVGVLYPNTIEKELDRHKSHFSLMESWMIGENTIEKNKEKILQEVKNINKKHIIVRYELPEITPIYSTQPRIVGWSTTTYKK
jgi:hypothetical protein